MGNHAQYRIITTVGGGVFINDMQFSVATMQYTLKSNVCQLPNSSLVRNYTVSLIKDGYFFLGTTTGELLIFSIEHKVLKAIIPISNQGLLSMTAINNCLIIGSGDGKIKKLVGSDVRWTLETEA